MSIARQLAADVLQLAEILRRKARSIAEDHVLVAAEERARKILVGDDPVEELRQWCAEHGHAVLPGDLVEAEIAAKVLGIGLTRLRNIGARLVHLRRGRRVYYPLSALAKHHDASPPGRAFPCSTGAR